MPVMIKRVVIYCILNVFYCAIKQYFCCKCSILFLGKKIFSKRTPEVLVCCYYNEPLAWNVTGVCMYSILMYPFKPRSVPTSK